MPALPLTTVRALPAPRVPVLPRPAVPATAVDLLRVAVDALFPYGGQQRSRQNALGELRTAADRRRLWTEVEPLFTDPAA